MATRTCIRLVLALALVGCAGSEPSSDGASSASAIVGDGLRAPDDVMADLLEYQPFVGTMTMPDGKTTRRVKLSIARRPGEANVGTTTMHVCETDIESCGDNDGAPGFAFTLDRSASALWYVLNLREDREHAPRRTHALDYQRSIGGTDVGGYVPTIKLDTTEFSLLVPVRFETR